MDEQERVVRNARALATLGCGNAGCGLVILMLFLAGAVVAVIRLLMGTPVSKL